MSKPLEKLPENRFTTVSNVPIRALYTPEDLANLDLAGDLAKPGEYPYTRGIHADMYRGRLWTMRLFSGFGTPEETNQRYHYLLANGQTGLSVAFDLPTLMGYDADSPLCQGEVGKCGVAVSSLKDMEILFQGIPLDRVTTSMTINAPAAVLLAMYIVVAEKQGVKRDQIGGTLQNDALKEFIAQKEWLMPPRPSVKLIVDTVEFCMREVPRWNTISISGYHIREAGSTAAQELGFTLADGIQYVQSCLERGLDVDAFAPRLSFFFNSHLDFFEEIAKFRAARRMWARIMRERFQARNPKSWMLRFHTQTAGCTCTAQQPLNNIARTAMQGLAAVLGGTQSLHTNSYDETLALPSAEAATIALRTQQIIAEETGVINTVDPLAGSYFMESLTHEMEEQGYAYIRKIDELGGMIKAIEAGYPQKEIMEAAYRYQQQVESKEKIIVGVNQYQADQEKPVEILVIAEKAAQAQRQRLAEVKANRHAGRVKAALEALRKASEQDANTMPYIIDAVAQYATLQEICQVFRQVWGEYREPGIF